jgi:hypothetical protein
MPADRLSSGLVKLVLAAVGPHSTGTQV